MSPVFDITVAGTPVPQGSLTPMISRSTGRVMVINKDARLATWRNSIVAAAIEAQPEQAVTRGLTFPLGGPIAADVEFTMPRPQNHYGTGKNAGRVKASAPIFPARMPDIDKLLRAILDALTVAQVWADDGQVVTCIARKRYGEQPGVRISVAPINA
jgi:Holliday junction resolvase RusA-like endonuclease